MGAILCPKHEQVKQRVVSCASKQLANHKKNYTQFLKEMAAMLWAMEHFDTLLISQCL
jgi:hypothetical protein